MHNPFPIIVALAALFASAVAGAEPKAAAKGGPQVRYFDLSSAIFSELNAQALLKEVRQGNTVLSAELEVCHLASADSNRLDRFVVPLKVEGVRLVGTGTTQEEQKPVAVNLVRRALAKGSFNFEGTVRSGDNTEKVSASDTTDISEQEMREQLADVTIDPLPVDFSKAWPQSLAVQVARTGLSGVLEAVRGAKARIAYNSVLPSCQMLRSGHYTVQIDVEPDSAGALLARMKAVTGVTAAGYVANPPIMQRAVRFPSAGWRDGEGRLARDTFAPAVAAAMAKALSATVTGTSWDNALGDLTIELTRPGEAIAGLTLTQVITVTVIVAAESPASVQRSMLWIETVAGRIIEDRPEPRLQFAMPQSEDAEEQETGEPEGTDDLPEAVAEALKGEIWDLDTERWKRP